MTHTHSEDKVLWLIGWYFSFPPDVAPRSLNGLFVSAAAQVFFHKRSHSQAATWLRSPPPPRRVERVGSGVWASESRSLIQTGSTSSWIKALTCHNKKSQLIIFSIICHDSACSHILPLFPSANPVFPSVHAATEAPKLTWIFHLGDFTAELRRTLSSPRCWL